MDQQHADASGQSGDGALWPASVKQTFPVSINVERVETSLRWLLHAATEDTHLRLHGHAGFAAVKDATIGLAEYRKLILRLYGFYVPFENAASIEPDRSNWLASDLEALGVKQPSHTVPECTHIPNLDSAYLRLGALYVVEGSALGGRDLARGLDRLLGKEVTEGRQFFIGRGSGTGEAWRSYLKQLSTAPSELSAHAEIITGAVKTFAAFEHWLDGWSTSSHG
jgi:heme oxygenase